METWVCAGWVLANNGDMGVRWPDWMLAGNGNMGVCLLVVDQQWRHGCVLAGC